MSSESSKQGHMKRINPTIWTKSEFYSMFLSFIVRILLSDIRSGSSFRARFPSADVGNFFLSCTRSFPDAAFIRYIWPCLSDWDGICGTKWRLKCPNRFFPEWKKKKKKSRKQQQKCSPLDTIQATAMFAVHRRLFLITAIVNRLFSAVYGSSWYGCRPYCLLAFSGSVLSSSESLLSQNKCRRSSWLAMFQLIHKWRNKSTGSCISLDYRWKFQYFMAYIERTRASSALGFEIRYY